MIKKLFLPAVLLASVLLFLGITHLLPPPISVEAGPPLVESATVIEVQKSASSCSLSANYPESILQWCPQIEKWAAYYGIEAKLIAALILQESGGQAEIISGSGAVGLMQVMPSDGIASTFTCINGPCFADRPSTSELMVADYNIEVGTKLLSGLVSKFGNTRDALFAYGPMGIGYSYADTILAIYNTY